MSAPAGTTGGDFGLDEFDYDPAETVSRAGYQCACGRFAKFVSERHYYNGQFDCFSYDVDCSRCGIVTVECV